MLLPSAFADPLSSKLGPPQYHEGKKNTTKLTTYAWKDWSILMIDYFEEPYNSKRKNNNWRTIGTKEEQLEQLEYGEDFCCCRSMIHICSLVDKVNSRVQRGSSCRTSVSKEFHKKPAEAHLAWRSILCFLEKNQNQVLPHFRCWNSWDLHSYLHISCREEEPSFVGRSIEHNQS